MLIEFRVRNFRSIKDEAVLSMVSSSDRSFPDHLIDHPSLGNDHLLKTAGIYGANASGKSNVLYAIMIMSNIVRRSHEFQSDTILPYEPFKLDEKKMNEPTEFKIVFIVDDIKHVYGFSCNNRRILEEYLHHYPNGRKKIIFERMNTSEYRFPYPRDQEQAFIRDRTPENVLFLSRATQLNYSKTKDAYNWFNTLEFIYGHHDINLIRRTNQLISSKDRKQDILEALRAADLGIDDITLEEDRDWSDQEKMKNTLDRILTHGSVHRAAANIRIIRGGISFDLYDEESSGTRRMYALIGPIIDSLRNDRILILDELDTKLHHVLVRFILDLFHDENNRASQMVFTTHDTNLLDRSLFRRDQIWFTEKDPKTRGTDLYSLLEFSPRNDVNIRKGYLAGRYGALPFIKYQGFLE